GGFNGNVTIKNNSDSTIKNWVLEFDYNDSIDSIWNAKIVSHEGNHYVIKPDKHNLNIKSSESISFGFSGTPANNMTSSEVPENIKLVQTKH
ncbi:MAG TPA: hypothetical protein DG753_06280, partial [Clostridium sp.]|nr:hypothetical protein [Clostridium sp.]